MRIYVASSWRNVWFPQVVEALRGAGHDVYDFRNPPDGGTGFRWSDVDEGWLEWTPQQYRDNLEHPLAERQFANDIRAMEECDVCVLLLPCGRSAHTEAGWFAGNGKKVLGTIYLLSPIILLNKYTHIYEKFQFLRKSEFLFFTDYL